MHELGIVFHVIKSVEEIAQENELTKVSAVTLSIGEVSGIVPSYLTDCWRWAADRSEMLRGARLCGGEHTWLLCGNETMIKEIEVPEEEPVP